MIWLACYKIREFFVELGDFWVDDNSAVGLGFVSVVVVHVIRLSICFSVLKNIAERYCVPVSAPWRFKGVWASRIPKDSRKGSKEDNFGS